MTLPYELALYAERNRNIVYDQVVDAVEIAAANDGLTRSKMAIATGKKLPQISAWLSGPSNWTLDTISHLLRAAGATMEYRVVFDKERALSNIFHPASINHPVKNDSYESTGAHTQLPVNSTTRPYVFTVEGKTPRFIVSTSEGSNIKSVLETNYE